jgi:hypothetical protein
VVEVEDPQGSRLETTAENRMLWVCSETQGVVVGLGAGILVDLCLLVPNSDRIVFGGSYYVTSFMVHIH